jgi:cysteine dioxygenase
MSSESTLEQTVSCPPPAWLTSIVERLQSLTNPVDVAEGLSLLEAISVSSATASAWTRFDERFYTRTSVFRNAQAELLVMGWLGGQMSPLHNHRGSICALKVLAGEGIEVSYERSAIGLLAPTTVSQQKTGFLSASADADVHQVGNAKELPLVTLHLYSPPLDGAQYFEQSESVLFDRSSKARPHSTRRKVKVA